MNNGVDVITSEQGNSIITQLNAIGTLLANVRTFAQACFVLMFIIIIMLIFKGRSG